jgi:ribosomal protein L13E
MVDVRVIIRRHFPIGRGRIVQEVAKDIVLRRQQARKLRLPECVERALTEDVLPLVEHPFDRGAVVAAREKITKYVAAACADPRLAKGGAQVLVLLDTFACPVFLRPLPRKPMMRISTCPSKHAAVAMRTNPCTKEEFGIAAAVSAEKARSIGVIGDRRPKQVDERSKGWVPW